MFAMCWPAGETQVTGAHAQNNPVGFTTGPLSHGPYSAALRLAYTLSLFNNEKP